MPMSFGDTKNSGEEKMQLTQQYDELKNSYCKERNIPLIRIPYNSYKELKIEDLLIETSNFII
jgi:hypothetical protein